MIGTKSHPPYGLSSGTGTGVGSGPFLEEMEARHVGAQEFHTSDADSRVIIAIADGSEQDVAGLMSSSGCIPLGQLLQTLERLQRFGLVLRAGSSGEERFRLSPSGKRAAQMMGVWRGA